MQKHPNHTGLVVAVFLIFSMESYDQARAGGPSTNGVAARAQSMQSAFVAVADDPSAVFYNPAGLTQIDSVQMTINGIVVQPTLEFESFISSSDVESTKLGLGGSFFGVLPISDGVSIGLGAYSPYARTTDYPARPAIGGYKQSSNILRLDVASVIAVRMGNLSIGGGPVISYTDFSSDVLNFEESGDGFSASASIGILYKMSEDLSVGAAFQTRSISKLSGKGALGDQQSANFDANMNFPDVLTFGFAYQVSPDLLASVQFDWQNWSGIESFNRNYDDALYDFLGTSVLNLQDAFVMRVGFEYQASEFDKIRIGYSYTTAAVPAQNIIPAFPDFDIHALSLGYGRSFGHFTGDICVELMNMPERNGGAGPFPGKYNDTVASMLVGLTWQF